nr:L,D-transpeptidase [Gemmatimonadaceae bacterium]
MAQRSLASDDTGAGRDSVRLILDSAAARSGVRSAPVSGTADRPTMRTRRERAMSARVRAAAMRARDFRLVVSLDARELVAMEGDDTLLVAPVAIGRDTSLTFEGRTWRFTTPRGIRRIAEKRANPVWIPPDWHYVEAAARD